MNDFTKEELETLNDCVWAKDYNGIPCKYEVLLNKIASMIDNYCEHEWKESAINAIYCPHCQKSHEI